MDINDKIFELVDFIDSCDAKNKIKAQKCIDDLNTEWDNLPEEKMLDNDRTFLALVVIDMAFEIGDFKSAEKWIEIYLNDEEYKPTILFHKARLLFHKENYEEAYKLFSEAQVLSNYRELEGTSYLEFYKTPDKYMK